MSVVFDAESSVPPAQPLYRVPSVPIVRHRMQYAVSQSETEMFVVKDGMQYKADLLLTNDWASQPISVLKSHIAPRWRTSAERLSIGCSVGRFEDQPSNDEPCSSIATPIPGQPAELWLWPAGAKQQVAAAAPAMQQPQQLPQQQMMPALPSLPSLTALPCLSASASSSAHTAPSTPDSLQPAAAAAQAPAPPQIAIPSRASASSLPSPVSTVSTAPSQAEASAEEKEAARASIKRIVQRVREAGVMDAYLAESEALAQGMPFADPEDLVAFAKAVPACVEQVLEAHHPQLHAAVSELLNKIDDGPALDGLLVAMEESTGPLLEVPALFSAAFTRMEEEQRARLLKRAVSFVLPFADRPRAGLALEACVRLQCSEGASGGVAVVKPLLDEILEHCSTLMRSGSGNFLVQQCIQLAPSDFADSIARRIKGSVESMSLHRHASHAVEQVLKYVSEPVLVDLLSELVRSSLSSARLARSQSGNYVLQQAITLCLPSMWDVVSTRIKSSLTELPPVAAERIWTRLLEKSKESGLYLDPTQNFTSAPKKTSHGAKSSGGNNNSNNSNNNNKVPQQSAQLQQQPQLQQRQATDIYVPQTMFATVQPQMQQHHMMPQQPAQGYPQVAMPYGQLPPLYNLSAQHQTQHQPQAQHCGWPTGMSIA